MSSHIGSMSCLLIAFTVASAVRADEIRDGIYAIHEKGKGTKVNRNDTGDFLILGERLTDKLGKATIASTTNDNQRFRIDFQGAGPTPGNVGPMAVMIAGRCLMIYSHSDPEADGTMYIGSVIYGEEAMQAVAKSLKVEPRLRQHPGHKLLVTWRPDKTSYRVGEPVMLTLKIKNVGAEPIMFINGGSQRGPRDNQFGFTAFRGAGSGKAVPDTGDPNNFGGLAGMPTLQPGEVFEKSVDLDKWFKFTEPDSYRITATFHLELHNPKGGDHWTLWDDYATGTCSVNVVAAEKGAKAPE